MVPLTCSADRSPQPHGTGHRQLLSRRRRSTPVIARPARGWCRSPAGTCRSNTPASPPSTWRSANARRPVRRQPHGRDRDRRQGRARRPCSGSRRNDASKLQVGQAQYSGLLTPEGTFVDDLLVYRLAPQHFLLVVNAAQHRQGLRLDRRAHHSRRATRSRSTPARAMRCWRCRARQRSSILQPLTGVDLASHEVLLVRARRGRRACARRSRAPATPARTGSRSSCRRSRPTASGRRCSQAGASRRPASRAASARATRCASKPACVCTATTSTRRRRRSKRTSAGSSAGRRTISSAPTRCASRRPAARRASWSASRCSIAASRATGYDVYVEGAKVGVVTSGTQTPYLKKAIGMAYVPSAHAAAGRRVRRSTSAAAARARASCRCRSTSGRRSSRRHVAHACQGARRPMAYPAGLKYTKDHEWIELVGRSRQGRHHRLRAAAARRRRLPRAAGGRDEAEAGQSFGTIESVKAVSELYAPVIGRGGRSERRAQGQAGGGQHRPARQLDDRREADQPGEAGALLDAAQIRQSSVK